MYRAICKLWTVGCEQEIITLTIVVCFPANTYSRISSDSTLLVRTPRCPFLMAHLRDWSSYRELMFHPWAYRTNAEPDDV